jgi:hypothetical protein
MEGSVNRYLVEVPHSKKNCIMLVDEVSAMGYLHRFDWGCEVGVHVGWVVIEAESEEEALMIVPTISRADARAIKLIKYTPETVRELHAG